MSTLQRSVRQSVSHDVATNSTVLIYMNIVKDGAEEELYSYASHTCVTVIG
jgi:hypothetical protein